MWNSCIIPLVHKGLASVRRIVEDTVLLLNRALRIQLRPRWKEGPSGVPFACGSLQSLLLSASSCCAELASNRLLPLCAPWAASPTQTLLSVWDEAHILFLDKPTYDIQTTFQIQKTSSQYPSSINNYLNLLRYYWILNIKSKITDILAKVFSLILSGKLAVSITEGLRISFRSSIDYAVRLLLRHVLHIRPSVEYIVVYFSCGTAKPPTR